MRLYTLGEVPWKDTQLFYHAMAHLGLEGVIICRTKEPYFCVGFHQDVRKELDTGAIDAMGIPYLRRETGGGTVRLDRDQVFYQVITRRDRGGTPSGPNGFSEWALGPAIKALGSLGIEARIEPPNDIIVDQKKISGNGGGHIGECNVLVGDLMVDFDPVPMCNGLRCPTETFRKACLRGMEENLTTVMKERPGTTVEEVEEALSSSYLEMCADGKAIALPPEVGERAEEIGERFLAHDWLFFPGPDRPGRRVKVREGVHLISMEIAPGSGPDLVHFEVNDGVMRWADLEPAKKDEGLSAMKALKRSLDDKEGPFMTSISRLFRDIGVSKEQGEQILQELDDLFIGS